MPSSAFVNQPIQDRMRALWQILKQPYSDTGFAKIKIMLPDIRKDVIDDTEHAHRYGDFLHLIINYLLKELNLRGSYRANDGFFEKILKKVVYLETVQYLKEIIEIEISLNRCPYDPIKKLKKDLEANGYTQFPSKYELYNQDNFSINPPPSPGLLSQFFGLLFSSTNMDVSNESKPNERTPLVLKSNNNGE